MFSASSPVPPIDSSVWSQAATTEKLRTAQTFGFRSHAAKITEEMHAF